MGSGSLPIKIRGEFSHCLCQNLPGFDVMCFGIRRKIKVRSGFFGQRWLNLGNLSYTSLLQPPPGRSWCADQGSRESLLPTTKSFPETRSREQLPEMWVFPQEEPVFDTVVFIFLLYFKACSFHLPKKYLAGISLNNLTLGVQKFIYDLAVYKFPDIGFWHRNSLPLIECNKFKFQKLSSWAISVVFGIVTSN